MEFQLFKVCLVEINIKKRRMKMKLSKLFLMFILLTSSAFATEEILKEYQALEKTQFSAERGEKFFRTERVNSKGDKVSCMTCHTDNAKKSGMTRANKVIEPLAPSANPERFTDRAKIEKWFKRNCNDVYDRVCTTLEKGDFMKYMMSIK
jgi:cytochrome c peroxidase